MMESTSRALVVCSTAPTVRATPRRQATAQRASQLRAHVWIEARHFFSRADAQQFCWLWLLGDDGRVHALRLAAARFGDDHAAKSLLARFSADPELPIPSAKRFGPAFPLPGAPVVPLPRWSVSWGHPVQQAIRAFAAELDTEVLAALGRLEVPGPFLGAVTNYNRLALLPPTLRAHRLQALTEFPPLLVPLLLDTFGRPDMFGTDEDEPAEHACRDTEIATVLDATDRGRDLVGALAKHYRIGRGLVRALLFREPWGSGGAPRDVLRLLNALPPQARPRDRAALERHLAYLRALPLRIRNQDETTHLARTFKQGWDSVWGAVEAAFSAPTAALRDTRDFLREAIAHTAEATPITPPDMEDLALAWLARLGPLSLLEASLRWHAQPLVTLPVVDGTPDTVTPLFGTFDCEWGHAVELTTRQALIDEGDAMHHCVGGYWSDCVFHPLRIVHLAARTGATATALYRYDGFADTLRFDLTELRGPCNDDCAMTEGQLAQRVEELINSNPLWPLRKQVLREAAEARAAHTPGLRQREQRPLDRKSRNELHRVLGWWTRQDDQRAPQPDALLRGAIAGFGYAEGLHLQARLAPGDALQLVREPNNVHDPRAVRIDWNGHKLGYVARAQNAEIARLLDAGTPLAAAVSRLDADADAWAPVGFEVSLA